MQSNKSKIIVVLTIFVIFTSCCAEHGWAKTNKPYKNHELVYSCIRMKKNNEYERYSIFGKIYWTFENKKDFVIKIPGDRLNDGIYSIGGPNFDVVAVDSEGREWMMLLGSFVRGRDVFELAPGDKMTFMSYFELYSLYLGKGEKPSGKGFYLNLSADLILPGLDKIEIFRDVKAWPTQVADQPCPPQ